MHSKRFICSFVSLFLLLTQAVNACDVRRFSGVATGEDNEIAYKEQHEFTFCGDKPLNNITRYYGTDGDMVAELSSNYRQNPFLPSYSFTDLRFDDGHQVVWDGDKLHVLITNTNEKKLVERDAMSLMTSGQGLHFVILKYFESILAGEVIPVKFLIATDNEQYDFIISLESLDESNNQAVIYIEIDNWLFRLFAPRLEVTYDITSKKLLAYRGPTIIKTAEGELQSVEIKYTY